MGPGRTDYPSGPARSGNMRCSSDPFSGERGRIPIRVCNPHPYAVSIGCYQKLGWLCHMDESDVQGAHDITLASGPEGVVEVGALRWRSQIQGRRIAPMKR